MKTKPFYKNNKHNNMNPKEKETNEEELKNQTPQKEETEETTEGCCQEEKYGECQLLHFR